MINAEEHSNNNIINLNNINNSASNSGVDNNIINNHSFTNTNKQEQNLSNEQEKKTSSNTDDISAKKNNQNDQVKERLQKIVKTNVKKINKQIEDENKKLEKNVKKYNASLEERKKIDAKLGNKILKSITDEVQKFSGQYLLERKQSELTIEQKLAEADTNIASKQIAQGQEKMQDMQKRAEESDAEDPDEDPKGNPLVSMSYLQRVYEAIQQASKQDQEVQRTILEEKNSDLQEEAGVYQEKEKKRVIQNMQKEQMYNAILQRNSSKRKQIDSDISEDYNNFESINMRYKKMLGLEKKYSRKLEKINDQTQRENIIKSFQRDADKILKMDNFDLKEETRKFDKNGNRVVTKKEKVMKKLEEKERKKEEKLKKKNNQNDNTKLQEQNIANNIINDKLQNNNIISQNKTNVDKTIKNAYNANNLTKNSNKTNKLDISNINNANLIPEQNNINTNNINITKTQNNKQNKNVSL